MKKLSDKSIRNIKFFLKIKDMNYMGLSKHDIEVLFYYYNNSITICFDLFDKIEQLQNDLDAANSRVSELANRINKAIEYINESSGEEWEMHGNYVQDKIIEILKGSDK